MSKLKLALVLLLTTSEALLVAADSETTCSDPEVRKEWRTLTNKEQAAYLTGLKVSETSKLSSNF